MIVGADAKALLQTYPRNPKPDPHKPYVPRIGRVLIALGRDAADGPYHAHLRSQCACQLQGGDGRGHLVLSAPLRPDD
jgi:hypothetical protein